MFNLVAQYSLVVLYILLAATYSAEAAVTWRPDQRSVTICCLTSAVLHGLIGTCHLLRLQ